MSMLAFYAPILLRVPTQEVWWRIPCWMKYCFRHRNSIPLSDRTILTHLLYCRSTSVIFFFKVTNTSGFFPLTNKSKLPVSNHPQLSKNMKHHKKREFYKDITSHNELNQKYSKLDDHSRKTCLLFVSIFHELYSTHHEYISHLYQEAFAQF